MHYGYSYGFGFGIVSLLVHIVFIVLVVWAVIAIIHALGGGRGRRHFMWESRSALAILNERFAKGEIDKVEYEERKKALMSNS